MISQGKLNGRGLGRVLMALAVVGLVAAAGPASAHEDGWRHEEGGRYYGEHRHGWHGRGPVYYYEPGYYYAPPPVIYAPPPVVYLRQPRPVYQPPSFNFVFPLR